MKWVIGGILILCLSTSLPGEELRIRRIHIQSEDVFDPRYPEFDYWFFRLGNRFHVKTRDFVLRRELLVREGDIFDRDLVEESERNLRRYRFLTDVSIQAERVSADEVDLTVRTEDQWTLDLTASLGSSGGKRTYDIGLDEENFLGLGKRAGIKYEESVERNTIGAMYSDPRLLGTWTRFAVNAQNSSDGHRLITSISQPFYSQDTNWSYNLSWNSHLRDHHLYFESVDAAVMENRQQSAQFFLSRAFGARYRRLRPGVFAGFDENVYSNTRILDPDSASQPIVADNLNPDDRRFFTYGATLAYDRQTYVEHTYIDNFGRTEDLSRGLLTSAALLRTQNREGPDYGSAALALRWAASSPAYYFITANEFGIRYEDGNWTNALFRGGARFYAIRGPARFGLFHSPRQTFAANISTILTRDVDEPFQVSLGEEDGLRGYKFKSFTGLSRAILNLEHRIMTSWENKLIGSAIVPFLDAGYIWGGGSENFGLSTGIGIRLGLKKYGRTQILRIDFAFPLVNAEGQEFSVSVATGQIFGVL